MSDAGTTFVGVRINNAVLARLDAIAEFEGLTRSAVINRLCEREVEGSFRVTATLAWFRENIGKIPLMEGPDELPLELVLRVPSGFKHRRLNKNNRGGSHE
jgi:hypothetical protein